MPKFTLHVDGEAEYSRAFAAMASEADNLSEPLGEVAEHLRLSISEQFRTEGAVGLGQKWRPLDPDYEAWKEAQVGPQPMLVFTGAMRSALTDPRAFGVTPRRMVYEPDSDIAQFHQRGDGVPERKPVALSMNQRRRIDRIFAEWLNEIRRGPLSRF